MNILITGANGFIGQALTAALLSDSSISSLILTDIAEPDVSSPESHFTAEIRSITADLTDKATCEKLFTPDLTHIYLLHGLMSSAAEANLDLGLRVNVDSTRMILDILRKVKSGIFEAKPRA
jgi:nucleoside-diphosphate-sugar epimerase